MRYALLIALLAISQSAMPQTDIGPFGIGTTAGEKAPSTGNYAHQINASGEGVAFVFTVPKSGTIDSVGIRLGTVTEEDGLTVSIETVGTDGLPTGTNYGSSTAGTTTFVDTDDDKTIQVSLGTSATAVAGDLVCVRIEWTSYVDGNLEIDGADAQGGAFNPAVLHDSGAGFASPTNDIPMLYLLYSDSGYEIPHGCLPPGAINIVSIQSDNTPDEVAFQFTAPVDMRLCGLSFLCREFGTTALVDFEVFNDAATPASLSTNDTNLSHDTLYNLSRYHMISLSPVSLSASDVVNVSIFSNDATNNLYIYCLDVDDANHWGNFAPSILWAERTDGGAFSEIATRKPLGALYFDQITTSGSGGLAVDPIVTP